MPARTAKVVHVKHIVSLPLPNRVVCRRVVGHMLCVVGCLDSQKPISTSIYSLLGSERSSCIITVHFSVTG